MGGLVIHNDGILEEDRKHHHSHDEHHHHGDTCGCSHDHTHDGEHHHHHDGTCGCGHDHSHEGHHHESIERRPVDHAFDNVKKQIYIIENLGCANCAAKMERKIQELPQVDFANLIYATKQLQIVTNTSDELLPVFQDICSSIEDGVVGTKQESRQGASERRAAEKEKAYENRKDIWELGVGAALMASGGEPVPVAAGIGDSAISGCVNMWRWQRQQPSYLPCLQETGSIGYIRR